MYHPINIQIFPYPYTLWNQSHWRPWHLYWTFSLDYPLFQSSYFLDTKDPTSCQAVSSNGIAGRGRTSASFSVKMSQRSQSYLQLGWKFQQCWNVTYWLILVTWEPFMRTSYLAPEEAYIDSMYPLEEEFLGSWKTLGAILLEARRPEGIPGSPLKELRWESQDLSSTGDQTQYYLIECSSSSKQGCYCYCFFPFVKE